MEKYNLFVTRLSRLLDIIAGWGIVAVMFLVVSNIILRVLFKNPILGTYEYVGFITALIIGLAIAYCAVQNVHIAVGFVVERFPSKIQTIIDIFTGTTAFVFLSLSTWHIGKYASSMIITGEVSPTTRTPFYPVIYIVASGFFVLCMVILVRLIENIRKVVRR